MYHKSVPDVVRGHIESLGLYPLITGIRAAINNKIVVVDFKSDVSNHGNNVVFGLNNGAVILGLNVYGKADEPKFTLWKSANYMSTRITHDEIETTSEKYLMNKLKKNNVKEFMAKIVDDSEKKFENGKYIVNQMEEVWKELNQYKKKYISSTGEYVAVLLQVMNGDLKQQDIPQNLTVKFQDMYKDVKHNVSCEQKLKEDKQSILDKDKFVWIRKDTGVIMAGLMDKNNNWVVPLDSYRTADDAPQEIRDPVLARLTMASMLRSKMPYAPNEWYDENKLYPCFDYKWRHENDGVELLVDLEMVSHHGNNTNSVVSIISKK